jgi:hypothetical protein
MTFYKFDEDDLFLNTLEMYPKYSFYVQGGNVYRDSIQTISGTYTNNVTNVAPGSLSLYEYNIRDYDLKDQDPATFNGVKNNYIYPFLIKNSKREGFKSLSAANFNTQLGFGGDIITGSYRMSASVSRDFYTSTVTGSRRVLVHALRNNFKHYSYLSPHYQYTSSLGSDGDIIAPPFGDKSQQDANLISIPSIMYGSSIKKGSLSLKYYITGSLVGELSDYRRNGELVQVGPIDSTGSGSVAGVVLYNEGFILLTGSWDLNHASIAYDSTTTSKWIHFGYGVNPSSGSTVSQNSDGIWKRTTPSNPSISTSTLSASFLMEYSGTTHTQTLTMLSHAPYGELNHSNNPTFVSSSDNNQFITGSYEFSEYPKTIKNNVYSQFTDKDPEFEKVVYISKIGIYDEDRNLIGIAKVATPVKKSNDSSYTFKLKLDI